jgi:regulator of replication initiation timing
MENEELKSRVRELQMIITNYTNKNEKKKKEASSERIAKIEKLYA